VVVAGDQLFLHNGFLMLLRRISNRIVSLTDYQRYSDKPARGARLICVSVPKVALDL
jgi:hypothetical protein